MICNALNALHVLTQSTPLHPGSQTCNMGTRSLHAGETPSNLARKGYDQKAQAYASWSASLESPRLQWLDKLFTNLATTTSDLRGLKIVELGCGNGVPTALRIAQLTGRVIGLDISATQIEISRENFQSAGIEVDGNAVELREEDILESVFDTNSVDAICAFYAIIHLSVPEQETLLGRCFQWLRPDGCILFNMATRKSVEGHEVTQDWLGMTAYWASAGTDGTRSVLEKIGFKIIETGATFERGDADFTWFICRKPVI